MNRWSDTTGGREWAVYLRGVDDALAAVTATEHPREV